MYRIEKISEDTYYIKFTGKFSDAEAKKYMEEFKELTKDTKTFSILVDLSDASALSVDAVDVLLDIFSKESSRLSQSVYLIAANPPLDAEFQYLCNKAPSETRSVVSSLEEAKSCLGIEEIHIKKD